MNAGEYRTMYARVRAQITSAVPASERDIDAMLAAAGADKPRTLRELDTYLGNGTGALFAADASCPAVVDRLTRFMSAAGLPVTPPGCGRCGKQKPLRHQRPQGRICDACARHDRRRPCARCGRLADIVVRRPEGGICKNCDLRDPSTFKQCDKCGRTRRVAVNRVTGLALCQQCLDLPEQPCTRCGVSAPVHAKKADGPICKRCYGRGHLPTRECGVCGQRRPIARPATDSHPDICAGCLPSLHGTCVECGHVGAGVLSRTGSFHCDGCRANTNRRCAFCGRTRPVTANWPAGPACSTCYIKVREQPGRCAACRRDKVLIGLDGSGQRVCGPCAGASADYLCGRCGDPGRVYQDGLCFRCLVADELRAVLASGTGNVPAQLQPLVDALMSADKPRSVLVWLRRSRAVQLLKELAQTGDPISHEALDALPTGRDVSFLRWVLVDAAVLPERDEYLERLQPWIEQTLAGQPEAHTRILLPYLRWHVLHRARRRAQRRGTFTAMSAARIRGDVRVLVELLDYLAQQDLTLATLGQHHVDEWLASGPPGRRQTLRSFLGWAAKQKLCPSLTVTANRPGRPSVFASDDESAAQLDRCLFDDTLPIDVRAAGALILLYGLTPGRIRRLRQDQLTDRDGGTYLRIDRHQLIVPPRLAALLRQLPRPANRTTLPPKPSAVTHLFPARALDRPADATAFYARLKRHGITPRGGRNTALINLASDLPAPVLAQMLGLHIATAVRWAKYAKRDWENYLAQRRADGAGYAAGGTEPADQA